MNEALVDKLLGLINQKYGSLANPSYWFIHGPESYQIYEPVLEKLSRLFIVVDITEPNLDVAVAYKLTGSTGEWLLEISLLGPYAVFIRWNTGDLPLTRQTVTSSEEKIIVEILDSFEIILLARCVLEIPIDLALTNAEPGHVYLYQALIGDATVLPWRSKLNNWWPLRGESGFDIYRETDAS